MFKAAVERGGRFSTDLVYAFISVVSAADKQQSDAKPAEKVPEAKPAEKKKNKNKLIDLPIESLLYMQLSSSDINGMFEAEVSAALATGCIRQPVVFKRKKYLFLAPISSSEVVRCLIPW